MPMMEAGRRFDKRRAWNNTVSLQATCALARRKARQLVFVT
jgi:hypothetical protein